MAKNKFIQSLVLILIIVGAQGCSNPLGDSKSRIDPGYGPTKKALPTATGFEPISGSQLSQASQSNQYIADATVGATTKDIRLTTTRNKIVYLSVQGQMISK
tara:strand:+ start:35865 stop:36170 length:306 start_codon:yes stop_codon:yes gene_type:complete